MARKISLDGLNQINNILSGGMRQPASLRDEQPLAESVSQPKVNPSDDVTKVDMINVTNEALQSPVERLRPMTELFRSNFNQAEQTIQKPLDYYEDKSKEATHILADSIASVQDLAKQNQEYLAELKALKAAGPSNQSSYSAEAYQKQLKESIDKMSQPIQEPSDMTKLLYAALPLVAGLASGQPEAGLYGLKMGQADLENMRKREMDQRKSEIAAAGKNIEGVGNLLKGEAEKAKAQLEREKKLQSDVFEQSKIVNEINRILSERGVQIDEKTSDDFLKLLMDRNRMVAEGAKDLSKMEIDQIEADQKRLADEKKDKDKGPDFKSANGLRKEFQSRPIVKEFNTIESSYRKVLEVEKNPSAAGDLSLVFAYMKILDPNSTVRESEQASASNAAGVPDIIRNLFNRIKTGEKLTPSQRKDFVAQAKNLVISQAEALKQVENEFSGLANQMGIKRDLVFMPRADAILKTRPKKKEQPAGQPKGRVFTPKEKQAAEWLKKNPDHPRAKEVRERLGL